MKNRTIIVVTGLVGERETGTELILQAEMRLGQTVTPILLRTSSTDFTIEPPDAITAGERIELQFPAIGAFRARHAEGTRNSQRYRFERPLPASVFERLLRRSKVRWPSFGARRHETRGRVAREAVGLGQAGRQQLPAEWLDAAAGGTCAATPAQEQKSVENGALRCFFHLQSGSNRLRDPEGAYLRDLDSARRRAIKEARAIAGVEAREGRIDMGQEIVVENESGNKLFAISFADAVEIVF